MVLPSDSRPSDRFELTFRGDQTLRDLGLAALDRGSVDRKVIREAPCQTIVGQPSTSFGYVAFGSTRRLAQTFHPAITSPLGSLKLRLQMLNGGEAFHIWAAIILKPGAGAETVLVEKEVTPLSPGWSSYDVDLSSSPAPVILAGGTEYAVRLRSDATDLMQHTTAAGTVAPANVDALLQNNGTGWSTVLDAYLTFTLECDAP